MACRHTPSWFRCPCCTGAARECQTAGGNYPPHSSRCWWWTSCNEMWGLKAVGGGAPWGWRCLECLLACQLGSFSDRFLTVSRGWTMDIYGQELSRQVAKGMNASRPTTTYKVAWHAITLRSHQTSQAIAILRIWCCIPGHIPPPPSRFLSLIGPSIQEVPVVEQIRGSWSGTALVPDGFRWTNFFDLLCCSPSCQTTRGGSFSGK